MPFKDCPWGWHAARVDNMTIFSKVVAALGVFEFISAYQWATQLGNQQATTNSLLPPAILGEAAHFQAPFVWALVMLGAVRVQYNVAPRTLSNWAMTLLAHAAEVAFWMHFAKQEPFAEGRPPLAIMLDAVQAKHGAFPAMVIGGPLLICVLLVADFPRRAAGRRSVKSD